MGRNKHNRSPISYPHKTKLKKDPGVPRLPDLKARQTEKTRIQSSPLDGHHEDATMASEPTLSSLARLTSTSALKLDSATGGDEADNEHVRTKEQLRRHYIRALHKVVDESDIILLVLDARDPEGCRSRLIEEEVQRREAEGKKLVFVLNKIDLVPRASAEAWLKYLRHTAPTLPFRSASSQQRTHLSSPTAPALLRLLKAYRPSAAQSIAVGVVGYPNVGKSSLINTLKRAKVCAVAAQPGHTKELQTVQLERGLRIVDSPGVIFDDADDRGAQIGVLLRNVVKVEDIEDPISVVDQILARTETDKIMKIYNLPEFTSTLEFLTMLSLSTGKLGKGGTPDVMAAARVVLGDWNHQKIPFYTQPPATHPSLVPSKLAGGVQVAPGAEATGNAQILNAYSAPFQLEGLFGEADAAMAMDQDVSQSTQQGGDGFVPDDVMQTDSEGLMVVDAEPVPIGSKRRRGSEDADDALLNSSGRAPKRLRKILARTAGSPAVAAVASRQVARIERKAAAKRARRNAAQMEVEE